MISSKIKNILKNKKFILLTITLMTSISFAATWPKVSLIVGHPEVISNIDQKKMNLKRGDFIKTSFTVTTGEGEVFKLDLQDEGQIIVFSNSTLKYDGYYFETAEFKIKRIEFITGEFYIKDMSAQDNDHAYAFESDIFKWKNSEENKYNEFYLNYDASSVKLKVCSGSENQLKAQLFDFEDIKYLKFQEGSVFQGKKENNKVAFDQLLEGKKSPKGQWIEDYKCDVKKILAMIDDKDKEYKVKIAAELKAAAIKNKKAIAEYNKSLCHEPNGMLNQCIWKKMKLTQDQFQNQDNTSTQKKDLKKKSYKTVQSCVRLKCNAQGKWSDITVVSESMKFLCDEKVKAQECDY